jgi:hypothetical protein
MAIEVKSHLWNGGNETDENYTLEGNLRVATDRNRGIMFATHTDVLPIHPGDSTKYTSDSSGDVFVDGKKVISVEAAKDKEGWYVRDITRDETEKSV